MRLISEEPVRVYLYGVTVAVVALLVGLGVVTSALAPLVLAVAAAVLAVPGVEAARKRVTPVAKLDSAVQEVLNKSTCGGCPEMDCEDCAYRVP